jgi:hypothetical protein
VDQTINGLPLPRAPCEAIAEQRWRPSAVDVLRAVLGEEPEDARFYDVAEMRRQNASLLTQPEEHFDWVVPGPAGWTAGLR